MYEHEKLELKDEDICQELLSNVRYLSYKLSDTDQAVRNLFIKGHPSRADIVVIYNYPAYLPLTTLKALFKSISGEEVRTIIKRRSSFCQNGPDDENANGILSLSVEMVTEAAAHKILLRCQYQGTVVLSTIVKDNPEEHLKNMVSKYRKVFCSEENVSKFVTDAIRHMDETRIRRDRKKSPEVDEDGFQVVNRGRYANPAPKKKDLESRRQKAKHDPNYYGDVSKSSSNNDIQSRFEEDKKRLAFLKAKRESKK